jgi:hypothetical protein
MAARLFDGRSVEVGCRRFSHAIATATMATAWGDGKPWPNGQPDGRQFQPDGCRIQHLRHRNRPLFFFNA